MSEDKRRDIDFQLRRVGVILGWMLIAAGACYTLFLLRGIISGVFNVLTPFLGAAVLAYILDPIVTKLQRRFGVGRVWGLIVVYSLVLIVAAVFLFTLVPIVVRQSTAASKSIARAAPAITNKVLGLSLLDETSFTDADGFIFALREGEEGSPGGLLRASLSANTLASVEAHDAGSTPSAALLTSLADDLNRALKGEPLHATDAFADVDLPPETRVLIRNVGETERVRVNRRVMEDAFPGAIARSQPFSPIKILMSEEFRNQIAEWWKTRDKSADAVSGTLPAADKLLGVLQGVFSVGAGVFGSLGAIVGVLMAAMFIVIISFYFIIDFDAFGYFARVVIPDQYEDRAFIIFEKMDRAVGGFLRGQLIVCFCVGSMTTVGLLLLGFHTPALARYCLLIGIVAGTANFIPYLGPILGAAPAVLIVLFAPGDGGEAATWGYRFWGLTGIGLMSAITQTTEGFVLQPYVVGSNSELHPLVVMLALIAGAPFGLGGMIVAVPVAAMARVVLKEIWWDKAAARQVIRDREMASNRPVEP